MVLKCKLIVSLEARTNIYNEPQELHIDAQKSYIQKVSERGLLIPRPRKKILDKIPTE